MKQNLSLDFEPADDAPARTVADLCHRIKDTTGLPAKANVTFLMSKDRVRAVGIEVAL